MEAFSYLSWASVSSFDVSAMSPVQQFSTMIWRHPQLCSNTSLYSSAGRQILTTPEAPIVSMIHLPTLQTNSSHRPRPPVFTSSRQPAQYFLHASSDPTPPSSRHPYHHQTPGTESSRRYAPPFLVTLLSPRCSLLGGFLLSCCARWGWWYLPGARDGRGRESVFASEGRGGVVSSGVETAHGGRGTGGGGGVCCRGQGLGLLLGVLDG
jgi:hypothetical protein